MKTKLIAEISANHLGDFNLAKKHQKQGPRT